MTLLAFVAQFEDEEWCMLVHGETRGKAKARFLRLDPSGMADNSYWNSIRLRRLPGQDDKPFTYETTLAAGFQFAASEYDENGDGIDGGPDDFVNDCDCEICKPKLTQPS